MILLFYMSVAWAVILLAAAVMELCSKDRDLAEAGWLAASALVAPIIFWWHMI